tara:strand:+ start:233 stop:751 length:519 start_codon:yes stop_codon:yes gene_type:complete
MMQYIKIYDLIGFKICWILCAFCTQWDQPYLGPIITLLFILIHLIIVNFALIDLKIITLSIICGLIIDSTFSIFGLIGYQGGILANYNLAPLWILSMWGGFSLTMLYTLDSIRHKYFLSGLLGFIGGPLSYSAGVNIGSLTINKPITYLLLSICWGLIIPFLFYYINKIKES